MARTSAASRLHHVRSVARFSKKVRSQGYSEIRCWMPNSTKELVASEARRLNVSKQVVMGAMLEYGRQYVTPSAIAAEDKRWHAIVGYPIGPVWPGGICDPSKRTPRSVLMEYNKKMQAQRDAKRAAR